MGYSFLFAQTFLFLNADLHGRQPVSLPWTGPQRPVGGREVTSLQSILYVKLLYSAVFVCERVCVRGGTWSVAWVEGGFFHPSTCRLPAGRADRNKTLTPMSRKGKKMAAQLVSIRETNTFSWTLKRKTCSKLSKWLKWEGESTLISKEPQSCCYDICIRTDQLANRNIF